MLFYHCKVSNKITGSSLPDIKDPQILFLSDCEASDIFLLLKGPISIATHRPCSCRAAAVGSWPSENPHNQQVAIPTTKSSSATPRFEEPSDICVALGASKPTKASDLKKQTGFQQISTPLLKVIWVHPEVLSQRLHLETWPERLEPSGGNRMWEMKQNIMKGKEMRHSVVNSNVWYGRMQWAKRQNDRR